MRYIFSQLKPHYTWQKEGIILLGSEGGGAILSRAVNHGSEQLIG